mgnify:CR=1 FL=1
MCKEQTVKDEIQKRQLVWSGYTKIMGNRGPKKVLNKEETKKNMDGF